ncbi:MAG: DUF4376 domain-containing protein [Sideroxydans sp.]
MFYSEKTGGFYDRAIHGNNIPADAVDVPDAEYSALMEAQEQGKYIQSNANGYPVAVSPPPPTAAELLAAAKDAQISTIEAAYTAAVSADIAYLSTTFQADAASQALISSVLAASGGALPAGFVWYDATNQPVVMKYAELQGLAGSILMRGQPLFALKQAHKAAIRAATTIAQVEAVAW